MERFAATRGHFPSLYLYLIIKGKAFLPSSVDFLLVRFVRGTWSVAFPSTDPQKKSRTKRFFPGWNKTVRVGFSSLTHIGVYCPPLPPR
jgi:hypothetical protein